MAIDIIGVILFVLLGVCIAAIPILAIGGLLDYYLREDYETEVSTFGESQVKPKIKHGDIGRGIGKGVKSFFLAILWVIVIVLGVMFVVVGPASIFIYALVNMNY